MRHDKFQGFRPDTKTPFKAALSACFASALLIVSTAQATPITSDLSISGSVTFDAVNSFKTSTASSAGDLNARMSGTNSSSAYSGSSGGSLVGNLTETGDGFGFAGRASANDNSAEFKTFIDLALNLSNNSASNTYKIGFGISFNNAVDANGADAFADSEFFVRNPAGGADLFFTDIASDSLNGDAIAGVPTGGFGVSITDSGSRAFFITLLPGATVTFGPATNLILWSLAGGAFDENSSATASLDAFLSINSVENLTQPPNPAPEPATLALLGIGLAGLGVMRRRSR